MDNTIYNNYIQILKEELIPAMGCTEPISIAYCAAKVRSVLNDIPDKVIIEVSGNILKNVKSVIIPNTNGLKGIKAAVALGIIAGNENKALEAISNISEEKKIEAKNYLDVCDMKVLNTDGSEVLDIIITAYKNKEYAKVRICRSHTNIVWIEKNGEVLYQHNDSDLNEFQNTNRNLLSVEKIIEFADSVYIQDVEEIIMRQIQYNSNISNEGIKNDWGANIGSVLLKVYGDDIKNRAKAAAAAGSDARMSGCELPVIINSGSGNQGMTCSLPVIEYSRELGSTKDELIRALVVSNLITIHLKTGIGRLSAYCGAISAGAGAGAGIAYILGGGYEEVSHTIVNALAITSGIICDGAKPSCAGKIAAAVDAGILGYYMYKQGQQFRRGDGIITAGVENTIHNINRLGHDGMKETDKEIISIMLEN
ncbi:MAG: serine dehydratase subunit alpha family protein [Holdemanella sp.]|nr:serine dehydratase subunit alpha family protein [Holdemanella sp.]